MKPYNSFCVESLVAGSESPPSDPQQQYSMDTFLHSHGLDAIAFQKLAKGLFVQRPYIPLPSQIYRGRVSELKTKKSGESGKEEYLADEIVIEADLGAVGDAPIKVVAARENIFVYGHWMGKADLAYILQEGKEVGF